jgi:hypothetical protein
MASGGRDVDAREEKILVREGPTRSSEANTESSSACVNLQLSSDGGCEPPVGLCCLNVAGVKESDGCAVSIFTLRRVRLAELSEVPCK